jgi:hypothetical protein
VASFDKRVLFTSGFDIRLRDLERFSTDLSRHRRPTDHPGDRRSL